MGQGQELHARKMMMDCMTAGGWVLLQNVHLSLPFCSEIIDILVETEHVDESFRLWVTTEVHEEFPIGLLQMAIKFTNEPPQGIRASLKRSYQVKKWFNQKFIILAIASSVATLYYTSLFKKKMRRIFVFVDTKIWSAFICVFVCFIFSIQPICQSKWVRHQIRTEKSHVYANRKLMTNAELCH